MIYTSILSISFTLSLCYLSSLQNSKLSLAKKDDNGNETQSLTDEVYEFQDKCNYTLVAPKKIINPYKSDIINFVPQKPFGSFHLKCTACLAIAYQIKKTIENVMDKFKSGESCQDSVNQNVSNAINELCSNGFKNYDLRKCKEFSLVTDVFKCTDHIKSNMDGGWTRKLRELCNLYTSHMDLEHISNIYSNNTQELSTHLCNGTGIFRDCQNLKVDVPNDLEELSKNCDC